MPAGYVRPRASQAPMLGAGALQDYRERGYQITASGRIGVPTTTGPCARCQRPHERYGVRGRPVCLDCSEAL